MNIKVSELWKVVKNAFEKYVYSKLKYFFKCFIHESFSWVLDTEETSP